MWTDLYALSISMFQEWDYSILKRQYSDGFQYFSPLNIIKVAIYNRCDLLEIFYRETNEFLENIKIIDCAAKFFVLNSVRFLTESGASCSTDAMYNASGIGDIEVVKYLHLNRSEGCVNALVVSSKNGHFEVVKYLVENDLGLDRTQSAIDGVRRYYGKSKILKFLELARSYLEKSFHNPWNV